jgi:copper(I)-binding protein
VIGRVRLVGPIAAGAIACPVPRRHVHAQRAAYTFRFSMSLSKEFTMKRFTLSLAALVLAAAAQAQVSVQDAWVRATVPQQKATGAFMQITAAKDARLVEVKSPVAGVAEIHEMAMVDNVMRMRAVAGVDLPAGKAVELKPGGYHVMLMDLKGQVKDGDTVPLTLVVEGRGGKRENVELKLPARLQSSAAPKDMGHGDDHGHGMKH